MAGEQDAGASARGGMPHRAGFAAVLFSDAMLPWLGTLVFIAIIELITRSNVVPQQFFPAPTTMFVTLAAQFARPDFWLALWNTLWTWGVSLAVASVLGVVLGVAMGASRYLHAALRLVVEFLRPVPSVALLPISSCTAA